MKRLIVLLLTLFVGAQAAMAAPSGKYWTVATSSPEEFRWFINDYDEGGWVSIQKLSNIVLMHEYQDRLHTLSPEVVEVLKKEFAHEFIQVAGFTQSAYVATNTFYIVGNRQNGITIPSEGHFDAALARALAASEVQPQPVVSHTNHPDYEVIVPTPGAPVDEASVPSIEPPPRTEAEVRRFARLEAEAAIAAGDLVTQGDLSAVRETADNAATASALQTEREAREAENQAIRAEVADLSKDVGEVQENLKEMVQNLPETMREAVKVGNQDLVSNQSNLTERVASLEKPSVVRTVLIGAGVLALLLALINMGLFWSRGRQKEILIETATRPPSSPPASAAATKVDDAVPAPEPVAAD